jgi:hypothetical protein
VQYKYLLVDAAGRPLRWQEGPNMALALGPEAACVAVDSWCQRMQLRRRRYAGGAAGAGRAGADAGVWEVCGGEDDPCLAPQAAPPAPQAASNVVTFTRAAAPAPAAAPALVPPPPRPSPPGSPGRAAAAEAQAALPLLQHQLEAALETLGAPRHAAWGGGSGGGSPAGSPGASIDAASLDAAGAADALTLAVNGLRQAQSIVLNDADDSRHEAAAAATAGGSRSAPAPPPSARSEAAAAEDRARVAALRAAFSPAAASYDEDSTAGDGDDDDDFEPAPPLNSFDAGAEGAAWAAACGGAPAPAGVDAAAVDPLVAALLSDDPGLCCAYMQDAISSCSSGEWPCAVSFDDDSDAEPEPEAPAAREQAQPARQLQRAGAAPLRELAAALARSDALGGADPTAPELIEADRALAAAAARGYAAAAGAGAAAGWLSAR